MQGFDINEEVRDYSERWTKTGPGILQELCQKTYEQWENPGMLSSPVSGRLLKLLVQISRAKSILEIGTFTGYSALCMAEALPDDGKLITCDLNSKYIDFAKKFWNKSPHGKKIEARIGNALATIQSLNSSFDFVFIDADKTNYSRYYEAVMPKLVSGGLIVVDNCLWGGEVMYPVSSDAQEIHALNELVARDERVENVMLTVRDGINVIRKIV